MSVVVVVYTKADEPFVSGELVKPLPSLGYTRWLSSTDVMGPDSLSVRSAFDGAAVVLVVASEALARSTTLCKQIADSLPAARTVICVRLDATPPERVAPALASAPTIDLRDAPARTTLRRALTDLLPAPEPVHLELARLSSATSHGRQIGWNEEIFSDNLRDALARRHDARVASLMAAFVQHFEYRPYPYGSEEAQQDLTELRRVRQFLIMRQYAEAVIASRTKSFQVDRQYAQALIELGEYQKALRPLQDIIAKAGRTDAESYEARGLVGRLYKQQYVNSPGPAHARLLANAIDAYKSAFDDDEANTWHGVNAASLILRASRDEVLPVSPAQAWDIAKRVIERLPEDAPDVFDRASRVEALLALDDYGEAGSALHRYLCHPKLDAFAVSSTHRQFDEVLQLERNERGRPLLEWLWRAVKLHRGGSALTDDVSALLQVSNPEWWPVDVPDLTIHARMGTVLSISGSERTLKRLLKDPQVLSLEKNRRGSGVECARSVPFIWAADRHPPAVPYSETGTNALVALVDTGIDVLHKAFLDDHGQSRIVGVWNQLDPTGPPPPNFTFGTYYDAGAIGGFVTSQTVPPKLGRDNKGHGTHVASIAAGRKCGDFAGGVAPDARILAVITDGNQSIGYSSGHLAALDFIDRAAVTLNLPVVVNVSQGMNAGAHDGTSPLERLFDNFVTGGKAGGRMVVKSAGNERGQGGHAFLQIQPDSKDEFEWDWEPTPFSTRQHLELWWKWVNELRVRLRAPAGQGASVSGWVGLGNETLDGTLGDVQFKLRFVNNHSTNGDNLLEVDLEASLTTLPGRWAVEIEGVNVPAAGDIHAWIERTAGPPSSFAGHAWEEVTLTIPGTAHEVITVGAIEASHPVGVDKSSSYGRTRDGREKPDVCAPGVNVMAAKAGTADQAIENSGTSMAAPHVAGAVALVLSRRARLGKSMPTSSQIAAVLRGKTQNFNGQWTAGQGWGYIDVAALLGAF